MKIINIKENIKSTMKRVSISKTMSDIDQMDVALLCLLTRFVVEKENINKRNTNWNILHSYLHYETTTNSISSIIKSIIYFLSRAEGDIFKEDIISISTFLKEFSDDYWTFKPKKTTTKISRIIAIKSCKLINPNKYIFGVKGVSKKGSEIYFFSKNRLIVNHIYNIKTTNHFNASGHKRMFSDTENDISIFDEYLPKTKNIIELSKKSFSQTYPTNEGIFPDIRSNDDKYFYYIKEDVLISSTPQKDIPFLSKKWIAEEMEIIEKEKHKNDIKNLIDHTPLPYVYLPNFIPIETSGVYEVVEKDKLVSNKKYISNMQILKNIFSSYANSVDALFMNMHTNKTIFMRPAGFGKSYEVIKYIKKNTHINFYIFTPTKKAIEVFNDLKILKNVKIDTIQKFSHDILKPSQFSKFKANFEKDDILFFDEISMYEMKHWNAISMARGYMQINFLGDPYQIQPIFGNGTSHLIKHIAHKNILIDRKIKNVNMRLDKNSDNYQQISKLLKDIRDEKINIGGSSYKKLFTSYDGYDQMFELANSDELSDYTFIVHKNNGVVSSNNFGRIIISHSGDDFSVGDSVIWNTQKNWGNEFYVGRKLTIKNILKQEKETIYEFTNHLYPVQVGKGNVHPFSHARTLTCHRAQGQSIKKVAIFIDSGDNIDTRWLYTAASRAILDLKIYYPFDFDFSSLKSNISISKENIVKLKQFIEQIQ